MKNFAVISDTTRLSRTTYLGWTGSVNYEPFTLRGAYIESSMDRHSPDKKRFQTNDGKYINHIVSGDVLWKNDLLSVQYSYGESENYLRRHLLFARLRPTKSLKLGMQIYGTHALDEYLIMPTDRRNFDKNAWHFALDMEWLADKWSTKWGIGYTDAKKENEVGYYPRHMSKNSRGTFISMAKADTDYMRDGELVLSNKSSYQLTSELVVGLSGNIAQFNYKNNRVRTGEINLFTRWEPTQPGLKDLAVEILVGPGWSYKMHDKTPILTNGRYRRAFFLGSGVVIEYKFKMF